MQAASKPPRCWTIIALRLRLDAGKRGKVIKELYNNTDLQKALDTTCALLDISMDVTLCHDYQLGLKPDLLAYEKVSDGSSAIPAIQKYLIGTTTYLAQPTQFYDIFVCTRQAPLLQVLAKAIQDLVRGKVANHEERLDRLVRVTRYDEFESLLYELAVAAQYLRHPDTDAVEFIKETPHSKTPDILFSVAGLDCHAECKAMDRTKDFSIQMRNELRSKLQAINRRFRERRIAALVDITFSDDPRRISEARLVDAAVASLDAGTPILETGFTVQAVGLTCAPLDEYALFPSPKYYWERYGFRAKSEWFGLVHMINGQHAAPTEDGASDHEGLSSWLSDVSWESAVKWKIDNDDITRKHRKIAFSKIFKGLEQLTSTGMLGHLHYWFERDHAVGNRQPELLELVEALRERNEHVVSWLIFNETVPDVPPHGKYDLIEHVHSVRGGTGFGTDPPVGNVFTTAQQGLARGPESFGIGANLPDLE